MEHSSKKEIQERIKHLDSSRRGKFDFIKIFTILPLTSEQVVADIGCGTGIFTMPLAKHLSGGKVYALDVEEKMLVQVRKKATEQGVSNIETRLIEGMKLPLKPGEIDGVFIANVLHETPDPSAFIKSTSKLLCPGGWMAILDWKKKGTVHGPPLSERLSPNVVKKIAMESGLHGIKVSSVGANHYIVLLQKE